MPLDQLDGLVRAGRVRDGPADAVERAADRLTPGGIVVENDDVEIRRIVCREDPPYGAVAAAESLREISPESTADLAVWGANRSRQ